VLYEEDSLLADRLSAALEQPPSEDVRRELGDHARTFDWRRRAGAFDEAALEVVLRVRRPRKGPSEPPGGL
jgi:hypothetical protein